MNWKTDLKLSDLDLYTRLEITCRSCGHSRYETRDSLSTNPKLAQLYLDQIEGHLRCSKRTCRGAVRVALIHSSRMEGFVGGMA
ncbi:MAG: hypothetical protein LCH61_07540 [Proteobacteria bacterium]|nr:hypothetical protein [Pseudomonadota bacterium]